MFVREPEFSFPACFVYPPSSVGVKVNGLSSTSPVELDYFRGLIFFLLLGSCLVLISIVLRCSMDGFVQGDSSHLRIYVGGFHGQSFSATS